MEGPEIQFAEAVIDNGRFGSRTVRFETGRLARQAGGSVSAYLDGETMLLATTTASGTPKDQFDFFPLTVDVEERMYALGKIPGSFFRREGRPSTEAILTCRLIDRPLRPSFVKGLRNEVQVVITVLALQPDHQYDVVAINAASAATQISGLPFSGPIGGVRVALIDGQWVAFPNFSDAERSTFDMVVAGRVVGDDVAIMMVEAEATDATWNLVKTEGKQAPTEEVVAQGLEAAKAFIRTLCEAQADLAAKAAKPVEEFPIFLDYQDDVYAAVEAAASREGKLASILSIAGKQEREDAINELKSAIHLQLVGDADGIHEGGTKGEFFGRQKEVSAAYRSVQKKLVRERILRDKVRIDGRGLADIRALSAEVEVLPRVHGSALFERGETQIMGVTTLNMHNYNFPPYSTGETGRVGSPKRREIGHGALAERALMPVLPTREEFPYAIRQVSEALGSNGSTSMGSVCASTLSLLNAGVPLRAPVAGIAMGLVSAEVDGQTQYAALTDILGAEDAFGDMDFKVAGTREFVTAIQLDTKLDGIGPKGKMINQIQDETGADISIEDDGTVYIGATDGPSAEAARAMVNAIANPQMPEVGERFLGTVVKATTFGAFVSLLPGKDGLLHISEVRKLVGGKRIDAVEDVLAVGQKVQVELKEIDPRGKLSLAAVLPEGAEAPAAERSDGEESAPADARPERGDRGERHEGERREHSRNRRRRTNDGERRSED